jgi:uncharacterized protein YdeI (YjbR/CyaY-like superfamily)
MAGKTAGRRRFFESRATFRRWLEQNHDSVTELLVGFWKKDSGKGGVTYAEALDEALCFGWIDGVRRRVDDEAYEIRFTPRKPVSKWSAVNLKRYAALEAEGRIAPPGRAAFERFDPDRHEPYSFETRPTTFSPDLKKAFQAHAEAWRSFKAEPPGYRRTATFYVMSAKRQDTRERRLAQLVEVSARGARLPQIAVTPSRRKKKES